MSSAGSRTAGLTISVDGVEHLVGARCEACATHTFPQQDSCPRCSGTTTPVALPTRGTVWSWTVQRIAPKPPYAGPPHDGSGPFVPFTVGYVDLGPVVVESRLEGHDVDGWRIGEPVDLTLGAPDADGAHWSFRFTAPEARA